MSKLNKSLMAAVAAGMLAVSGASGAVTFSDGGTGLQGVINGKIGPGLVNVNADQMSDDADSYWAFGHTSGSIQVILGENTLNAGNNSFGLFSGMSTAAIFNGGDSIGDNATVSYLGGNINVTIFNSVGGFVRSNAPVAWTSNTFGFYLNNGTDTFKSDTSKNTTALANGSLDAMVAYRNVDPGTPGESILAFEDNTVNGQGNRDTDYDDFVVMVESVYPVPAPATLALLGLGLIGIGYRARRKSA